MADQISTLGRATTLRGEVLLRRRITDQQSVDELIVNGIFAMDSTETASERELARLALHRRSPGARVLVGGLGLGFTAYEALQLPVDELVVVELEPALVEWAHAGLTPTLAAVAADPRVSLLVGDVTEQFVHPSVPPAGGWDAIVLDVDNGPDFLIHDGNAPLYADRLLASAYEQLAPVGRLAIWCQGAAPALCEAMRAVAPTAQEHLHSVSRGRREFCYAIYTLDRNDSAGPR